jgi:hypothetical protein
VLGPEDLSCNDIAYIMSEVLGKPVRFQQIPPNNYKAQLMQNGASEAMAQGLVDMAAEVYEHGIYNASPQTRKYNANNIPGVVRPGLEASRDGCNLMRSD